MGDTAAGLDTHAPKMHLQLRSGIPNIGFCLAFGLELAHEA